MIKKILLISPRYYPYIGGVEHVVKITAEMLKERGYRVTVFSSCPRIFFPKKEFVAGIEVIKWPAISIKEAFYIPVFIFPFIAYIYTLSKRYKIIHIHSIHSLFTIFSLFLLAFFKKNDQKLIWSPHYIGLPNDSLRKFFLQLIKKILVKIIWKIDKIIFGSKWEMRVFLGFLNRIIKCCKYAIIDYPLDESIFSQKRMMESNKIIITMSGRFDLRQKRYDLLVKSIYNLIKNNCVNKEMIVLRLIGNGPDSNKIKKIVKELNLMDNTEFYHNLSRKEYLRMISSSTIYVLLSEKENYGIAPREAIVIGLPVVVSDNSALSELVKERLAVGVENEIKDITKKLCLLLTNKESLYNFSNKSRNNNDYFKKWRPREFLISLLKQYLD